MNKKFEYKQLCHDYSRNTGNICIYSGASYGTMGWVLFRGSLRRCGGDLQISLGQNCIVRVSLRWMAGFEVAEGMKRCPFKCEQ